MASDELVASRTNRPTEDYNNPRGALFILSDPWSQVASPLIAMERLKDEPGLSERPAPEWAQVNKVDAIEQHLSA